MSTENDEMAEIKQQFLNELESMNEWLEQARIDYNTAIKLRDKKFIRKKIENLQQASEKLHKKSFKIIPLSILILFYIRKETCKKYPELYEKIENILKTPEQEMRYKRFSAHLPQLWTAKTTNEILQLAKEGTLIDFLEYMIKLCNDIASRKQDENMLNSMYLLKGRDLLLKMNESFPNIKKFYQEIPMAEIVPPKLDNRKRVEQELRRLKAIQEYFKPTRYLLSYRRGRFRLKFALLIMDGKRLLKNDLIARISLLYSSLLGIFFMLYCLSSTFCLNNILGPLYSAVRYPEGKQIEGELLSYLPDIEQTIKESLMAFEFGLNALSVVEKIIFI